MLKNAIIQIVTKYRASARRKRTAIFHKLFTLSSESKIIDLGSEDGSFIHSLLSGTEVENKNVFIADISEIFLKNGAEKYGYQPILIHENGRFDFPDKYFDIVFCSSVIEHVTIPKDEIWELSSGSEFRKRSIEHQRQFAEELQRIGKYYFVQTPYPYFPVESHTWLPFLSFFPRFLQIKLLGISNQYWVKKSSPDWNLLNKRDIRFMFPGSTIIEEKSFGFVKSLIVTNKNIDL